MDYCYAAVLYDLPSVEVPQENPAIAISESGVVIKSNTMVTAAAVFKALGGTVQFNSKYIQGIIVTVGDKKLALTINDKYEAYQKYYGKTAWLITPEMYLTDLNVSDGNWLDVTVVHKGRTYIAIVKEANFAKAIYMTSPIRTFRSRSA